MLRTLRRRPDMFQEADFQGTKQDRRLLAEVYEELKQEKMLEARASEAGSTAGLPGDSTK